MSVIHTGIDGLQIVFSECLKKYSKEIQEGIGSAAEKAAENAVQRLQAGGPYKGGKATGYNAGWKMKVTEGVTGVSAVIYNAKAPGLTHLLEKGHAMPQGGRSRAFPHIAPAEEEAVENFKKAVERVIKDA